MTRTGHRADVTAPARAVRDVVDAAPTIGSAWLDAARCILDQGTASTYDGAAILEVETLTLQIDHPTSKDDVVTRFGDPERLAWMHANFTDPRRVDALGGARSYASRLHDYAGTGRDQVDWIIERLRADPTSRSATITTFEPLLDTTYIPCVSLLDFWIRAGALEVVVYAHSIDFGAKGYGNLVELAHLHEHVAAQISVPVGRLVFIVKSAHVYDTELVFMREVLERAGAEHVLG